jgi:hypothetical protein
MLFREMEVRTQWVPETDEEKDQVKQQMQRLLETQHFRNSRRYPALFRFIVEETLEGRGEFLKERLLGIRVFNRPPDYDTASDPIVRVTIAEIRKRIAQYYHEEAHDAEMRIELMPGRYEPEFCPRKPKLFSNADPTPITDGMASALAQSTETPDNIQPKAKRKRWISPLHLWLGVATLAALTVASLLFAWKLESTSALDQLWHPILAPHAMITFCLPSDAAGSNIAVNAGIITSTLPPNLSNAAAQPEDPASPTFLEHEKEGENVVFSDVLAAMKISNWIAVHNGEQRLRLDGATTLDDLQQGPTILIGSLDNMWTLRAIAHLRYQFRGTDQEKYWIADTKNPDSHAWEVNLKSVYSDFKQDFALIARVHDDSTGQIQVIVAGIGMSGTAAAGEFLVDPARIEELQKRVGPGFRGRDFEAVLGTDVVNGIPGSARILAVEVW